MSVTLRHVRSLVTPPPCLVLCVTSPRITSCIMCDKSVSTHPPVLESMVRTRVRSAADWLIFPRAPPHLTPSPMFPI
ncbi:hypothetical protein CCFV1_ORF003 [Cotesia congregata filamentous virus 1]|uniref:Secreted protein n=1 Tax=Cotesia congregata filamentous virus 1 TaxID=3064291 RepID=A0ABC8QJI3_9VIRU|nr:hypothetical protein CCFV1_ORF003 [Cotesia congregata filamentous virus 1]